MFGTIFYLSLFLISASVIYIYRYIFVRPSGFPNGPPRLPFIGTLLSIWFPPHRALRSLVLKYGPIFSIYCGNYPTVVLSSPELIRKAFTDDRFSDRPVLKPFLERSWGSTYGLIFNSGPKWLEQRKFSHIVFKEFGLGKGKLETLILSEIDKLVFVLQKETGKAVQINTFINTAILNTIWTIMTGDRIEYSDPKYFTITKATSGVSRFRSLDSGSWIPYTHCFLPILTALFPNITGWTDFKKSVALTNQILGHYIEKHKKSFVPGYTRDLIDVYLEKVMSTTDPDSCFYGNEGERTLLMTMVDMLVAGGETSAHTIVWAVLRLVTVPEIQEQMHQEINNVVGQNRPVTLQDRPNLPYVNAYINECFRMTTFGALAIMHCTNQDVPDFAGYFIPKGTLVCGNIWTVHHNTKVWGDPENFKPERFIENPKLAESLYTFSKGKRSCPGSGLSQDQFFLFLTRLLQEFVFEQDPICPAPCLDPTLAYDLRNHTSKIILRPRDPHTSNSRLTK